MYTVSIDRIGLVIPIKSKEMHGHFCGLMKGMKGDSDSGYKYWRKKYQTNAIVPLSNTQTLRLQVGTTHHKSYVKFDFNPASLNLEEREHLYMHLGYMLEHGYDSLLTEAHVSYIEVATDCSWVVHKEHLPFDTKVRNSGWYPEFHDPSPTCYLGRRGSERVIRVYDRAAKLKAYNKPAPDYPMTRVEAVLRGLQCKIADLSTVPNPLSTFGSCRFEELETSWKDARWANFLANSKSLGVPKALRLADADRKTFVQRLRSLVPSWWNSDSVWSAYPQALEFLTKG